MQKEFDKVAMDKEDEISCVRDHDHQLLLQIKKAKDKAQDNQKLEFIVLYPSQKNYEHKQKNYEFRKERTENQQTKQNTRSSIPQGD